MRQSEVTGIIGFPRTRSNFRIAVKLPAGARASCLAATLSPMIFLSDADILRETLGAANLESSLAQF